VRRLRRILLLVTALLTAMVVATAGLFAAWLAGVHIPLASGTTYLTVEKLPGADSANRVAGGLTNPFYVLLVGNDSRPGVGGSRGDALHVMGVNPKLKRATMINIPRDTCWNGGKINTANTRGPRAAAQAVGGLLGVPIAYVVDVDFAGFEALVDGVGGVDVNVPMPMDDVYSGAVFPQGKNHMNGRQALSFSRNRHDFPNSDITRTSNQGVLILDAMRQLQKQMQSAPGEFRLLALLGRHAQLDGIGIKDLYRLSRIAFSLKPDQIQNITIPINNGGCLSLGAGAGELFADFRDNAIVG
jgi:polyisoprenyl-teichoic acid--peptidoglycan teichoic acid transferase